MRFVIEGWRVLPHSYSVVAQALALELAARPDVSVAFRDVAYFNPAIQASASMLGDADLASRLEAIPTAAPDDPADATLRLYVPLSFRPAPTGRTLIFATTEFGVADPRLTGPSSLAAMNAQSNLALLTSSAWSRSGLIRSGADPDKIVVMPLGVGTGVFHPATPAQRNKLRRKLGWQDSFVFLNVGALSVNKGVVHLLKALAGLAAEFPQTRLVLKGVDALYTSAASLAEYQGVLTAAERAAVQSRLEYIGKTLSYAETAELFQAADAYVTPYHAEGFNLPALEAAACGLPVICTAGGSTDGFTDPSFALRIASQLVGTRTEGNRPGCELAPSDEHLAELMRRLLGDADFVGRARTAGPVFVTAGFTWSHLADRILALLGDAHQPCWQARPALTMSAAIPLHVESAQRHARALEVYAAGNRAEAARLCRENLRRDPLYADSTYLLGAVAFAEDRPEEALVYFRQAVEGQPGDARFHNGLGEAYRALGRPTDAIDCFRGALLLDPTLVSAANALGLVQLDNGDAEAAIESFRAALAVRSDFARAHLNLGRALQIRGDLDAAVASYHEAIRLDPKYAIAYNNLGAALQSLKRPAEAIAHFQKALEINPAYPEANFNLGVALQALADPVAAAGRFQEAIRLRPAYARAHFHLGQALARQRLDRDALACYETAARLDPQNAEVHRYLGDLLILKKDWAAALAALERAAALAPDDGEAFARLVHARQQLCDWRTYEADHQRLWAMAQSQIAAGESTAVVPFQALTLPWPRERAYAVARSHCQAIVRHQRETGQQLEFQHPRQRTGRLRIGYLSGDYYDHPVAHHVQGLLAGHDRSQFEAFAYSFSPADNSVFRQRIVAGTEHFKDIGELPIPGLARRIADDGIHILVDLMLHTGINRFHVMPLRAAPIQVSYLGMAGTTGADFIDYLITDGTATPPEFADAFGERLVTLPDCLMVADREPPLPEQPIDRRRYGLPERGFVFASFNSSWKLEPRLFQVWMRILDQVPGSVLWLQGTSPICEQNLRREAAARGIDPGRLIFATFVSREEHLQRHRVAGLFLDALIYNAASTACTALATGLPVLTYCGETMASRVGASLLQAAGLPELVATTIDEYVQIAVRLARQPAELDRLRAKLAAERNTCPLFDVPRFIRNVERAYQTMWATYEAGQAPRAFDVL